MFIPTPLARMRFAFSLFLFLSVRFLLADATQANDFLQQGRVDEATAGLREILAAQPDDAKAHQLLCRIYYAQEMTDNAIHECELAVSDAPSSSDNQMWLGRAYGFKASHPNPLHALNLAITVRIHF